MLSSLEQQIHSLTSLCSQLMENNQTLSNEHMRLQERNSELQRKNEQARNEIKKCIRRIRSYGT